MNRVIPTVYSTTTTTPAPTLPNPARRSRHTIAYPSAEAADVEQLRLDLAILQARFDAANGALFPTGRRKRGDQTLLCVSF